MSRKVVFNLGLIFLIIAAAVGVFLSGRYYSQLPDKLSQHETIVLGQSQLLPGGPSNLRVLVRDSANGEPLNDAEVVVSLRPESGGEAVQVFSGRTNADGTAAVSYRVPENLSGAQELVIESKSALGQDKLELPVTVERDFRVLLTTDKPIYQPGQVIHVRALALSAFDLFPAQGQEVEVTIADGKGNKVFKQTLTTSDYGVAFTDFTLANEVNTGAYKISARMGNTSSEKTVTVEHYVLPKFAVELTTDRDFYLPGQRVEGSLKANYFFGKPVAGGQVLIEGYTFDFERVVTITLEGQTDEEGNFTFSFDMPTYLAGTDLNSGMARYYLQASVTDLAQHTEVSNLSLPVSAYALVLEAIPEGGTFRPGMENILYVLTSYPDGSPAESTISVTSYDNGQVYQAQTGAYGLAEIRITPNNPYVSLSITAQDNRGNGSTREFYYEGRWSEENILLRPDKPVYRVGESMTLSIFTTQPQGTVYLDLIRDGQTVSTRSVKTDNGRAEVVVDLTPDLFGTLELHAYKILRSGAITRDSRVVVVDQADTLSVDLRAGADTYRPGETAGLDFQVNDAQGSGIQSVLGLAIVDESVFALAEQDPGFAKLYFLLEQELLVPKYDLHGYSIPDLVTGIPSTDPLLERAVDQAANASLAAASQKFVSASPFSLSMNSHEQAMQNAYQRQDAFFNGLSRILFVLMLAIPLIMVGLSVAVLLREKQLGKSLALLLGLGLVGGFCFLSGALMRGNRWDSPLYMISDVLNQISIRGESVFLWVGVMALVSLIVLAVTAIRRKDLYLGWLLGGAFVFIATLIGLGFATSQGSLNPPDSLLILVLIAFGLMPLAVLLRFAGFTFSRRWLPALAALFFAGFLLVGTLPLAVLGAGGGAMAPQPAMLDRGVMVEEAAPLLAVPAPMATQVPAMDIAKEAGAGTGNTAAAVEPPRLRQYFPETMLWLPDAVTEVDGSLHLDVPVADSITTWRMTVLASTQSGQLGSTVQGLRVFQDFFIDLDLPTSLTVGDEVAIPVGVFNYLTEEQSVRLELDQAGWFELLDEPVKELTIAANDIQVVYFRVRALDFGQQPFKVTAYGSRMSDAIQKDVRVFPDGKLIQTGQADRLSGDSPVRLPVFLPNETIPGTQKVIVKIYPGVLSQLVEGLDSILRMPFGCFEQTSSTTYPNVLVLDYLRATGQVAPEVEMKAEEYINLGYQRLTTFEVAGSGGFSLFGDAPADRMLTAYGLQEFSDMSRVYEIDSALIERAGRWLLSQQASDGSWENDRGLVHENTWASLGNDRLPVTAYIVWSLIEAGFYDDSGTQKGLDYIAEHQSQAEDPYVVALVANALVAADRAEGKEMTPNTQAMLDRLANLARMENGAAYWDSSVATFMGSEGKTGSIETTALAALAFLRADRHPDLANAALTALIREKDSFGTWYSTQATVLSLKALLESVRAGAENVAADVQISLNGGQTRTVTINDQNYDVVQMQVFEDINLGQENALEITMNGNGNLMYQVTTSYYLPWEDLAAYPELMPVGEPVTINVQYDRTELTVNDTVSVTVTVQLNEPGAKSESAMVDLGLPPGFSVETQDLDALVTYYNDVPEDYEFASIQRYELTGRQILIYLTNLTEGKPLQFTYRLRAKYPLKVQSPASSAYDYYNPDQMGEKPPQVLVVQPGS